MSTAIALPAIIQGDMGVGVSGRRLARAVSSRGPLGVVSGTARDTLLVRRLTDGDPAGHLRRAIAGFPVPDIAEAVIGRCFRPGGRADREPLSAAVDGPGARGSRPTPPDGARPTSKYGWRSTATMAWSVSTS